MTDDELKAQLDRIEAHAKKAETHSGCVLGFVIASVIITTMALLFKACGG